MEAGIVGLVLVAALLHVTWNVLLKTAGDPMRAATTGIAAATVVVVPAAAIGWLALGRPAVPPAAVRLAILSGLLETAYFVFLSRAYQHGELSLVYPTARGTAPMLAVLVGVVVFGERLGSPGAVGVVLLLAGLLALTRPWRLLASGLAATDRASTSYALATGVVIAAYSAIDREGARLTEPWLYAALIWPAMAAGLLAWHWVAVLRRARATNPPVAAGAGGVAPSSGTAAAGAAEPPEGPDLEEAPLDTRRAVVGGLLTLAAYALILFAYTRAPLTAVAPLRESAVVVASGWGTLRLGEAEGRRDALRRLLAAGLVAAGIVLLVFEG